MSLLVTYLYILREGLHDIVQFVQELTDLRESFIIVWGCEVKWRLILLEIAPTALHWS